MNDLGGLRYKCVPTELYKALGGDIPEVLWRAEIRSYDSGRAWLSLNEYIPIKFTPKGCWAVRRFDAIIDSSNSKVFILLTPGKKRFAYRTKEEALSSLRARKDSHLAHLKRQIDRAERCIYALNKYTDQKLLEKIAPCSYGFNGEI